LHKTEINAIVNLAMTTTIHSPRAARATSFARDLYIIIALKVREGPDKEKTPLGVGATR
jgi:hypothetical protein